MRQILFRGKRIDNGEWVTSDTIYQCNGEIKLWDEPNRDGFVEVIPETVGQFTGLLDDNGNKIFEGDILVFALAETPENERSIVVYDDGKFKLKYCNYNYMDDLDGVTAKRQIIVGNIHDNPELLEDKQ